MDAIEYITIGAQPDDGTGDSAREGGAKINRNAQKFKAAIDNLAGLNLSAGPVTKLAPGANPTASLTGTAPNYTLSLGLPEGAAGAGAANSADILAIAEKDRLERSLVAAGVPDEPSLILDFVRGVQFASKSAIAASIVTLVTALGGVSTFARASTATYWDSDGLLKTAANNVPRLEYNPLTRLPRGLLMENQSRTNRAINNVRLSSATVNGATRVADVAVSPDGTTTMSRITSTVSGGANTCTIDQTAIVPNDALTRTFSAFVRQGNTPQSTVNFYYSGGTFVQVVATINWSAKTISGTGNPQIVDCGGGLYRVSVTLANNSSGNTLAVCRVYVRDQGTSNNIGEYVDTGTWQLEEGDAMSSPIITGASAVTRAGDALLLSGIKWLTGAGLSAVVEIALQAANATGAPSSVFKAGDATSANYVALREGAVIAGADLIAGASSVTQIDSASLSSPSNATLRYAFGEDATGWAFTKDNAAPLTGGAISAPSGMDRLYLGDGFMGHIRRVLVWPQRLSNTKVQALSNQAAWS